MDDAPHYQVIFSGTLREGFEPAQVRGALAERLRLPEAQLDRLFGGRPLVLKRTRSAEEAKRVVALLASLGAISRIQADKGRPAGGRERAATAEPAAELPKFSPYPKGGLLLAALLLGGATELFFGLLYLAMLLAFSLGLLYINLFTTWGFALIGFAPLALLLQLLTMLAGLVLLLLTAKPLLSLSARQQTPGITLREEQEPKLYAFVNEVSEQIGAPPPQAIRIDHEIDVGLHYQGLGGFVRGHGVLTIGAPLVAACDSSQLAALLAQSLQLFHSKSLSPRAAFLLRSSDGWLQRAIYGEDRVDRKLAELLAERSPLSAGARLLQRLIAHSRRALGWRLVLSRQLNRRLIHRLVADADKVALVFCGSAGFTPLMRQQLLLTFASQEMLPELRNRWQQKGQLPDNLVQSLLLRLRQYPPSLHARLLARQEREKAASHDTIPADSQRLRRVSQLAVAPAYPATSPATSLFRNFTKLARSVTVRFYHNRLRIPVTADRLVPSTAPGKHQQQQQRQLDAIFNALYDDFLPLKLRHAINLIGNPDQARAKHAAARATSASSHSHAELALRRYHEVAQALVEVNTQEVIQRAGLWRQWGIPAEGRDGLEQLHTACREQEKAFNENLALLQHQLKPQVQRLAAALALLASPEAARLSKAAALQQEVATLVEVLERIEQAAPRLHRLRLHTNLLQSLLSYDAPGNRKLQELIQEQVGDIQQQLAGLGAIFKTTPYPFGNSHRNLMQFALRHAYEDGGPSGELDRGSDVVGEIARLQRHAMARLCAIALHVEKGLGL